MTTGKAIDFLHESLTKDALDNEPSVEHQKVLLCGKGQLA
jgi:hypothetical protein